MDTVSLTASFDALTPQVLRARGSLKWSKHPQAIGAWVAESDLGTAPAVTQVLEQAVRDGSFGYLPPGLPEEVAQATASFQASQYGWEVSAQDVSLLADVLSVLSALLDRHTPAGSAVIVPTPAYMPFLTIPAMFGHRCVQVPSLRGQREDGSPTWTLDLDRIEEQMRAGAGLLVLCNPWNPVGRVLSTEELDAVAAMASRYGVTVFADEIHGPVVLEPGLSHTPFASRPGADPALTYTATSVAKGWNLAGLKCAQLIASGEARRRWESSAVSQHLTVGATILGARATVAALSPEGVAWMDAVRTYLHDNAVLLEEKLARVPGLALTRPQGTYLSWVDLSGTRAASSPARYLLTEAGLVVNDGAACGTGYESFCRVNLATSRAIVAEIGERIIRSLS